MTVKHNVDLEAERAAYYKRNGITPHPPEAGPILCACCRRKFYQSRRTQKYCGRKCYDRASWTRHNKKRSGQG